MAAALPYARAYVTFTPRTPEDTPADAKLSHRLIAAMAAQPGCFDYVNTFDSKDPAHSVTSLFLFSTPEQVKKAFDVVGAQVNQWTPKGRKLPDVRIETDHIYVTARKGMALTA